MKEIINKTETIEQLFEDWKMRYSEDTPQTDEQREAIRNLEEITLVLTGTDPAYDSAIALSRASEKAGFILGFRTAMNLMRECMG